MAESPNIGEKYQRLATEYAKLRAQIPILKKGVIDEQSKSQSLEHKLNCSEQSVRRFQQEIDTLTIRNKQLAVRVEVLQTEAETVARHNRGSNIKKNRSNSGSFTAADNGDHFVVLKEELEAKILENAALHSQAAELAEQQQRETQELRYQVARLEEQLAHAVEVGKNTESRIASNLEQVLEERAILQVKLISHEKRVQQLTDRLEAITKEHDVSMQVSTNNVDNHRMVTNTDVNTSLLVLSEPSSVNTIAHVGLDQEMVKSLSAYNHEQYRRLRNGVKNCLGAVTRILQSLAEWHLHSASRLRTPPLSLDVGSSEAGTMLTRGLTNAAEMLNSAAALLQQIIKALDVNVTDDNAELSMVEAAPLSLDNLRQLAEIIVPYCGLWPTLIDAFALVFEHENNLPLCSALIRAQNDSILVCFKENILPTMHLLKTLLQSDQEILSRPKELCTSLVRCSFQFQSAIKELVCIFNKKISLEHALPTTSAEMKRVNELMAIGLVKVSTQSFKVCQELGDIGVLLESEVMRLHVTMRYANLLPVLQLTSNGYSALLRLKSGPPPASQTLDDALDTNRLKNNTNPLDASKISELQSRVAKLESEREHWQLDAQLANMRLEKMTTTTTIGCGAQVQTIPADNEREKFIRQYQDNRLHEEKMARQLADSQATHWATQCEAAMAQLKNVKQVALNRAEELVQMRDALETTQHNMGDQLNAMTEHMLKLSEELAHKEEQLDRERSAAHTAPVAGTIHAAKGRSSKRK